MQRVPVKLGVVKSAVAEKLLVQEAADIKPATNVPSWVPDGKYVALVRGVVAAVGNSVAEVSATAMKVS